MSFSKWLRIFTWSSLLFFSSILPCMAAQPAARVPIPGEDSQAKARKLVLKLFADQLAQAKTQPEVGLELAKTLYQESLTLAEDLPLKYVALREALDLSARAGDPAFAYQTIAALGQQFQVKELVLKAQTLTVIQNLKDLKDSAGLAGRALNLLDEALAEDDYETAKHAMAAAENFALRTRDMALLTQVQNKRTQFEAQRKEFEQVQPAFQTLNAKPEDPEACAIVGRYLCFEKDNWGRGLPLLAKGKDEALKKLAAADLAQPTAAMDQLGLGDGWWDQAEQAQEPGKTHGHKRAYLWYEKARSGLAGLHALRVQKRMEEMEKLFPELRPVPVGFIRAFPGHTSGVHSTALFANERKGITASWDRSLRLWDLESGKELLRYDGHTDSVNSLDLSRDEKQILSGGNDRTLRLWDLASGKEIRQFVGHQLTLTRVLFAPDGKSAYSCSMDKTVRRWNLETGQEIRQYLGPNSELNGLALSPDGKNVFAVSGDGSIWHWDADTAKTVQPPLRVPGALYWISLSPDGKTFLTAGSDNVIRLWGLAQAKEIRQFLGHTGSVWMVIFTPDGRRILSAGGDHKVRLWETETGKSLYVFEGHSAMALGITCSRTGRYLFSGDSSGGVRLWGLPR